jgi:hypothetical protein
LLTIYDCLRRELIDQKDTSIESVLDVSRKVSLIRYAGESFRPSAYQTLIGRGRGSKTEHRLSQKQEAVLAALWDWRDKTARRLDESISFVLSNDSIWRLSLSMPTRLSALQSLLQPLPPHLVTMAPEILALVKQASSSDDIEHSLVVNVDDIDDEEDFEDFQVHQKVPSSSSAFFKPTPVNHRHRRGMMSPVLGTEALYKQAGWMTPQEVGDVETSATDNEEKEDDLGKPKRLLSVHASNSQFHAKQITAHTLDLSSGETSRGKTVDGMATVLAARDRSTSPPRPIENVIGADKGSSVHIRNAGLSKEAIPGMLGVLTQSSGSTDMEEEEDDANEGDADGKVDTAEDEFVIPRSIREIYKISNKNRRNKKTFSPTPERGVTPTTEKEKAELADAEALLKQHNDSVGYLFDQSDSPKRPRTKSSGGSEGSPAPEAGTSSSKDEAKEEDLAFLREVGWVQEHESNESILVEQYASAEPANETSKNPYFGYTPVAMSSSNVSANTNANNPFFGVGRGTPSNQKARRPANNRSRRQERPEKKDSRSFAYRGKR